MEFSHIPVLLNETLDGLNIRPDGIYVDGTIGGAGHSREIVKRLSEKGRLIGIDQDEAAVEAASGVLSSYGDRVRIVRGKYSSLPDILQDIGIDKVNGILLDLGVSSYQLDSPDRGFSYREDAVLDMRMDQRQNLTAEIVVNTYTEDELKRILRDYGEERYAGRIAHAIVKRRERKPVRYTGELSDIIKSAVPEKYRNAGKHPAKRSFQAIRIEVNRELDVLKNSLGPLIDSLGDHGRLCVITFHSLEDRLVKEAFNKAEDPCICPPQFPVCVCGRIPKGRIITRKPVVPGEEEQKINSRSKSAKLRVFERVCGLKAGHPLRKHSNRDN